MKTRPLYFILLCIIACFTINSCGNSHEPSRELKSIMEETKATLPLNIDVYTTLVDVYFDGDFFVYDYDISNLDEEEFVENVIDLRNAVKDNLEQQSLYGDKSFKTFYSYLISEGFGISYRYHFPKTGTEKRIDFNNDILP